MKLKRERYISYFHKPIVQRWTTPSSSWRQWRSCWRRWRPRRQRPAGVFPLQSSAPGLCFVVSVFRRRSLSRKPWGGLYIVVFRSRRSFGKKDRRQRRPECQDEGSHAVMESGRVGPLVLPFRSSFLRFLCAYVSFQIGRASCRERV